MTFPGLPPGTGYTPVPHPFLGPLLEQFHDLDTLKCALRLLFLLHRKRGAPKFVTFQELAADLPLARALGGEDLQRSLKHALEGCLAPGIFLHLALQEDAKTQELYLLNTPENQLAVERIRKGLVTLTAFPKAQPVEQVPVRHNIFELYERTIGPINPLIAEELKEAETLYPAPWIEEAFHEAALQNKRRWSYILRILQRWSEEGKEHGTAGQHPQKVPVKELLRRRRSYGPLAR